jgi:hypothetical protein
VQRANGKQVEIRAPKYCGVLRSMWSHRCAEGIEAIKTHAPGAAVEGPRRLAPVSFRCASSDPHPFQTSGS